MEDGEGKEGIHKHPGTHAHAHVVNGPAATWEAGLAGRTGRQDKTRQTDLAAGSSSEADEIKPQTFSLSFSTGQTSKPVSPVGGLPNCLLLPLLSLLFSLFSSSPLLRLAHVPDGVPCMYVCLFVCM